MLYNVVMKIRNAEIKDLKAVQELNNQLFELELANFDKNLIKGWSFSNEGKAYFENAIKNSLVIVAEIDDIIVGYLLAEEIQIPYYSFKIAELCNMCVDENYRKQGIGRALYENFEIYYKSKNIDKFMVTASFKNESAKNFYKKMGFVETNSTFAKF